MIAELTIDLGALRRNARRLAAHVAPSHYAAVVKSNAYGHGLVPVARALEGVATALCVYRADEALAIRAAGIATPLLILGPVETRELDDVSAADAAIALWDAGAFRNEVARAARKRERRFPVHVKVDTGTTRLGFDAAKTADAIASLASDDGVDVRGVYTHLAAAEELESDYTVEQLQRFERALAPVEALVREHRIARHAAASAAAMLFPASRYDLVRAGIATYGIWPSPETRAAVAHALELEPVLAWTTKLVVVRDVEAGRSVGYGCGFHAQRASRIGVLPIGYAEGLPRSLFGAGVALVGGRRVPIVGRVCMNMTFVDVTGVPEAHAGSTVTLVGCDGEERLEADELAGLAGTIGYELVARLPAEVPRRYLEAEMRTSGRSAALTG
ncbi:MAG: alanine racemase [Candidatus Eremiobacteraeota bacterium]|nr:alanine racemase [Candidatus Eremiobacteraeota bacterium]